MKKQLRLSELKASLSRNGFGHFPSFEIDRLKDEIEVSKNMLLLEYVPVKIVACLEEGFRQQYKSIIDSPFYRKNLKNIRSLKDTKFDFDIISAFEDNEVSLGDYISYLLPCNGIQDIITNLNELLGVNYIDQLQEFLNQEVEFADIEDHATVILEFPHARGLVEGTWATYASGGIPTGPVLYGETGTLVTDRYGSNVAYYNERHQKTPPQIFEPKPFPEGRETLAKEFLHALKTGETHPMLSPALNLDAMAAMDAALRSAKSGKMEKTF